MQAPKINAIFRATFYWLIASTLKTRRTLKNRFKKLVFDVSAAAPGLYTAFHRLFYSPKAGTLAHLLQEFSRRNGEVYFVQVGANDGFFHDPLHKFIRMYKWRGILLEPQPDVYETFLKRLHRNTPDVHPVNAALSDVDGTKDIYRIAFSNSRWATGLTSFNRSALEEAIDSGHVARCAARYGESLPDDRSAYIESKPIASVTAETLLTKYALPRIDWLQIDAEGYDFEIIKLMKIPQTAPRVIAYEHSHLSGSEQQTCLSHLRGNGYEITEISENTVAMKAPVAGFDLFFTG